MSESGDPVLIGRAIGGKYVVEKFLGGGAMGAVYKARHDALERDVAIKVMHRSVAVDASFVARFHREAKAASRLDHPNSMRVIDFGEEEDGLLYIAMEFVSGRDLYRVIHEDWPISNARIVDILSQALAAVAVAHDMGVIHRDLKPENIMMVAGKDDEGKPADIVKVCDFGIAKITEKDEEQKPNTGPAPKVTTQGLVVGTPDYMSPEQARGEKLDARSDLYSMGVILYQLLTGRVPFEADTALAIVLKHITDPPQPPHEIFSGVHKGLEDICLKALEKDRAKRFQDAREMRVALRSALENRPSPSVRDLEPTQEMPADGPPKITPIMVAKTEAIKAPETDTAVAVPAATLTAEVQRSKSSGALYAGIGAVMLLVGGGGWWATHRTPHVTAQDRTEKVDPAPTQIVTTPTETRPNPTSPSPNPTATNEKPRERVVGPRNTKVGPRANEKEETVAVNTPEPVVEAPPPVETHPPEPAQPVVEPKTPEKPPEAPKFNPATCKASVGKPQSNGSVFVKDLRGEPSGAWNACAKKVTEKISGSATVTVHFDGSGVYKSTTCAGCPAAVNACVQRSSPGVSLAIRSGDITGYPEFAYPVTFSCD